MVDSKKANPIDVDKIDLEQMKKQTTDIPGLLEFAHSVGGFSIIPSDQGAIKGRALAAMEQQTQMQMDQIYKQMKLLAEQAKHLQTRADISLQIYNAVIGFEPIIGQEYYLYERKDNSKLVSMVSPDDWGGSIPYKEFVAKVKLLADHTWEVIEKD